MPYLIKHQTNSPLLHIYETALLPLVCQTENKKLITWLLQVPAACMKKSSCRPWKRECIKSLLLKLSHQVSLKNITRSCHLIVSYSILSWITDLKGGRVVCIFKRHITHPEADQRQVSPHLCVLVVQMVGLNQSFLGYTQLLQLHGNTQAQPNMAPRNLLVNYTVHARLTWPLFTFEKGQH